MIQNNATDQVKAVSDMTQHVRERLQKLANRAQLLEAWLALTSV